jgi:hypothetical protein
MKLLHNLQLQPKFCLRHFVGVQMLVKLLETDFCSTPDAAIHNTKSTRTNLFHLRKLAVWNLPSHRIRRQRDASHGAAEVRLLERHKGSTNSILDLRPIFRQHFDQIAVVTVYGALQRRRAPAIDRIHSHAALDQPVSHGERPFARGDVQRRSIIVIRVRFARNRLARFF